MKYYLTLDIGGTDLKYGVITNDLNLVYKNIIPTEGHLGANHLIGKIKNIFKTLSNDYLLEGISISTTGGIDNSNNVLFENLSIKDYHGLNFSEALKSLNVDILVENDVNSMGMAEISFLDNKNLDCVLTMTVGTGIGGAIFFNNKLFKGFKYTAGEIGKNYLSPDGKTYENLASVSELVKSAQKLNPNIKNGLDVFNLYDQNDLEIKAIVHKFYNNLAYGIANIIYTLNPNQIIIGGGITNRGNKFLEELKFHLKDKLVSYLFENLNLSLAKNKNDAGMIGAFIHFKNKFLS